MKAYKVYIISYIITSCILSGCATTPQYRWNLAKEKTPEQASRELSACERDSIFLQDEFGTRQQNYIYSCMAAQGHHIEEIK